MGKSKKKDVAIVAGSLTAAGEDRSPSDVTPSLPVLPQLSATTTSLSAEDVAGSLTAAGEDRLPSDVTQSLPVLPQLPATTTSLSAEDVAGSLTPAAEDRSPSDVMPSLPVLPQLPATTTSLSAEDVAGSLTTAGEGRSPSDVFVHSVLPVTDVVLNGDSGSPFKGKTGVQIWYKGKVSPAFEKHYLLAKPSQEKEVRLRKAEKTAISSLCVFIFMEAAICREEKSK